MRPRVTWWWAVALYMIAIFVLSSMSTVPQPPVPGIDKPEHYIAYGGLAIIAFLAVRQSRKNWNMLAVALAAIAIASAYGMTDEFHQSFVPARTPDIWDWVTDVLGAISGALIASLTIRLKQGGIRWKIRKKKAMK